MYKADVYVKYCNCASSIRIWITSGYSTYFKSVGMYQIIVFLSEKRYPVVFHPPRYIYSRIIVFRRWLRNSGFRMLWQETSIIYIARLFRVCLKHSWYGYISSIFDSTVRFLCSHPAIDPHINTMEYSGIFSCAWKNIFSKPAEKAKSRHTDSRNGGRTFHPLAWFRWTYVTALCLTPYQSRRINGFSLIFNCGWERYAPLYKLSVESLFLS